MRCKDASQLIPSRSSVVLYRNSTQPCGFFIWRRERDSDPTPHSRVSESEAPDIVDFEAEKYSRPKTIYGTPTLTP